MKTKEDVWLVIKESVGEILPDLDQELLRPEISLKDLGANSIDRMDIIVGAMESLDIRIPMLEFGAAKNIGGLVDLLYTKRLEQHP